MTLTQIIDTFKKESKDSLTQYITSVVNVIKNIDFSENVVNALLEAFFDAQNCLTDYVYLDIYFTSTGLKILYPSYNEYDEAPVEADESMAFDLTAVNNLNSFLRRYYPAMHLWFIEVKNIMSNEPSYVFHFEIDSSRNPGNSSSLYIGIDFDTAQTSLLNLHSSLQKIYPGQVTFDDNGFPEKYYGEISLKIDSY